MGRDLKRDLGVLDQVAAPDLLNEAERRAAVSIQTASVADPRRLSGVRAVALGLCALAVTIGGFVWLGSSFRSSPRPTPPAEEAGSQYVFANVLPHASEPDEDGNIQVRFEVAWSDTAFPGLHRCHFQALAADGSVASELVRLIAFNSGDRVWMDVPPPAMDVSSARVVCDSERLDTPGIAQLDPLDPAEVDGDLDRWLQMLHDRVDAWAVGFNVAAMSSDQLAWNIVALSSSVVTGRFPGDAQAWAWQEWSLRRERLCSLLPPGHTMRNKGCLGAEPRLSPS